LIRLLKDKDPQVRGYVVSALGDIGDPMAISPLVSVLQGTDEALAELAGSALVKIGGAAEAALRPLARHPDTTIRERVLGVLNQIAPAAPVKRNTPGPRTGGLMDTIRRVTGSLKKKE